MKIARLKFLLIILIVGGLIAPAYFSMAFSAGALSKFFDHPFDAVSVSQDAAGNMSTTHTISDGRGHIRTESVSPSATLISIFDHESNILCTIREKDKVIMKNKIAPYLMEPDAIPKQDLQQLGTRVVNGHPCTGESYHFANTNFVTWRGQDVDNYTVKSVSKRNGIQTVTELKSYKTTQPDPSMFIVPTEGYTVQGTAQ
jgi:hypothetical protein